MRPFLFLCISLFQLTALCQESFELQDGNVVYKGTSVYVYAKKLNLRYSENEVAIFKNNLPKKFFEEISKDSSLLTRRNKFSNEIWSMSNFNSVQLVPDEDSLINMTTRIRNSWDSVWVNYYSQYGLDTISYDDQTKRMDELMDQNIYPDQFHIIPSDQMSILMLSQPIFSSNQKFAIVQVEVHQGALRSTGYIAIFKKKGEEWYFWKSFNSWAS